jgi:hypothetical protein
MAGNANAAALNSSQVEQALGGNTIDAIAQKVGVTGSVASAAIGYLVPKLIGQLTPDGVVGSTIPNSVSGFLRGSTATDVAPPGADDARRRRHVDNVGSAGTMDRPVAGFAPAGWAWLVLPRQSDAGAGSNNEPSRRAVAAGDH